MAVKRFDVKTCMMQENQGKYVNYADYEALKRKAFRIIKKLRSKKEHP